MEPYQDPREVYGPYPQGEYTTTYSQDKPYSDPYPSYPRAGYPSTQGYTPSSTPRYPYTDYTPGYGAGGGAKESVRHSPGDGYDPFYPNYKGPVQKASHR